MKNWTLEPTGIPGVSPLDPTTIPKWVNQLTKPPVHVPVMQGNTARYTVTAKKIRQQLLPPGFPTTQVFAYGGVVNFAESGQRPDIRTAFTMPGPTFEAVRGRHILVRYRNELEGDHIFPVDPTLMVANPNNAPMPDPPFKPFPPGYRLSQDPDPGRDPLAWRRHAVRLGRLSVTPGSRGASTRRVRPSRPPRSTTSTRSWRPRSGITTTPSA